MQAQLALDFTPVKPTTNPHPFPALTIDRQFMAFHEANPHIYQNLRKLALDAQRRAQLFGMKALFEILRWQYAQATQGAETFKLNNNYTCLYARLLMDREPALAGYFETRQRTSAHTRKALLHQLQP